MDARTNCAVQLRRDHTTKRLAYLELTANLKTLAFVAFFMASGFASCAALELSAARFNTQRLKIRREKEEARTRGVLLPTSTLRQRTASMTSSYLASWWDPQSHPDKIIVLS